MPFRVLLWSVVALHRHPARRSGACRGSLLIRAKGKGWFESRCFRVFHPLTVVALLATLVLIFAFQADNLLAKPFHVVLIAIPILMQVYFNAGLAYGLMKLAEGAARRRGAGGADRREQLLRAGGRDGDRPLRAGVGGRPRDGRRRPRRGSGHALGLRRLQPDARLVSCGARCPTVVTSGKSKRRVLFLCTGNSCRSQMAEGFLRHLAGERFEASSAGTEPSSVHPDAIRVMAEKGIDLSGHESKGVARFLGESFAWVVTVCDQAAERCPVFPGAATRLRWSFDDPARAVGTKEERLAVFRRVRDEIEAQVRRFVYESEEAS